MEKEREEEMKKEEEEVLKKDEEEEGESERKWLEDAGFEHLVKEYESGKEVKDELGKSIQFLFVSMVFGQRTRRGRCPTEQRGECPPVRPNERPNGR